MLATVPSSSFRHSFFESVFLFTIVCSSPIEPFGFNALSFCESIVFVHLTTLRGGKLRLVRTVEMVRPEHNTWRGPLWNFEQKMASTLRPPPQFYCCPPSTQTNIIVATSPLALPVHHEREVRKEQHLYIYVARTSNKKVIMTYELYYCLLPQCEALRTCHSVFPIATLWSKQYNLDLRPPCFIWRQGIHALQQPSFCLDY